MADSLPESKPPILKRRLDQLLAATGHGSRHEVRDLIRAGLVTVRGQTADDPGLKAEAGDVLVEGEPLEAPDGLVVLFHKPVGYVCTHAGSEGPAIYDLLPARWKRRTPPVTSIGRLDKDTSGLLLLTDRGELVQRLTSPRADIAKVYEAEVDALLDDSFVTAFASGTLMLRGEEKPCLPAKLEITAPCHARITLTEGRYHQVRRMFAALGRHVVTLHRTHFGEHALGDLAAGEWRVL